MKKINELNYNEENELSELLEAWLGTYTSEVVAKVMPQIEEIINNDLTMMMLRELKARQDKEKADRAQTFRFTLWSMKENNEESVKIHIDGLHNHVLEHSGAYRHILHDLYITPTRYWEEEHGSK